MCSVILNMYACALSDQIHLASLTVWPWAECSFCSILGLFFSFFSDQMQTFVYSPEVAKILQHPKCYRYCCLYCVKYIFFWFHQSVGFKGNIKYAKKHITSAMECADEAVFTFTRVI